MMHVTEEIMFAAKLEIEIKKLSKKHVFFAVFKILELS